MQTPAYSVRIPDDLLAQIKSLVKEKSTSEAVRLGLEYAIRKYKESQKEKITTSDTSKFPMEQLTRDKISKLPGTMYEDMKFYCTMHEKPVIVMMNARNTETGEIILSGVYMTYSNNSLGSTYLIRDIRNWRTREERLKLFCGVDVIEGADNKALRSTGMNTKPVMEYEEWEK